MKYINKTRVTASQTDAGIGLSVLGAAQIIQDNVCAFFACFKKDNVALKTGYNAVWVFVKNKFKRLDIAEWNEEITVESFITARTSATIIVDTAIRKSNGRTAVYARTEMCVINLSTQRICRISSVELEEDIPVYPSENGFGFCRIGAEELSVVREKYSFYVPSTSIDYCMHLNNVEYLRFILNAVSVDYAINHVIKEVEIHFACQSREGEKLSVLAANTEDGEIYEVKNGEKTAVKCKILR